MDTAPYERLPSQPAGIILGETYRLLRRIGIGGMGEVYEAAHVRLPGRFAVKILLPDLIANPEAFARFCREAEIMSELRHPNIVQIFDFNTTPEGRPYFVMELLEGRDLESRLSDAGPLPLPAVVRIVEAVASALAAAHGHGVVHRDLKPANIFLATIDGQADEIVKVLDFGISQVRASDRRLSQAHHVLGTPPYMAPEQVRGAVEAIDGRADQFALGAIAYRMLTGRDAFQGPDTPALLYQIVHEDPPPLVNFFPTSWETRPLQAVLDRALAKQPDQRWGGMMELARAFEDAAERTVAIEETAPPPVAVTAPGRAQPSVASAPPSAATEPTLPALPVTSQPPAASAARVPAMEPTLPAVPVASQPPVASAVPEPELPAVSDEPPPIRLRRLPNRREAPTVAERVELPPALARPGLDWETSTSLDRIPKSNVRAATLGVIALLLAGTLVATGWYRDVRAAVPFARENLRSWLSSPPPEEQPAAAETSGSFGEGDKTSPAPGLARAASPPAPATAGGPPEPPPLPATGGLSPSEPGATRAR